MLFLDVRNLVEYTEFLNEAKSRPQYYPSKEVDKAIGTKLYTKYKMPGGSTDKEVEEKLLRLKDRLESPAGMKSYVKLYKDLVKLNPQLDIAPEEYYMWDVIMGAASGYSVEDIRYWIEETDSRGYANISNSYKNKVKSALNKVEQINPKYHGGYLPSPASLKIIENALKTKAK